MKPRHTSQAGPARIALRAALMLVLLAGCTPTAPSANTSPSTPIQTTATPATACDVITQRVADRHDELDCVRVEAVRLQHQAPTRVDGVARRTRLDARGRRRTGGQGRPGDVLTPAHDLYVAVWSAPATDTPETLEGVAAWVEQYCKLAGRSCSGLDRSVPLCNGTDCDPGLLVTDDGFVEAFFTGGKHKGRMIAVEVGLPEWAEPVAEYGGARRLLEGFLSGMGVCPARPDQSPAGLPLRRLAKQFGRDPWQCHEPHATQAHGALLPKPGTWSRTPIATATPPRDTPACAAHISVGRRPPGGPAARREPIRGDALHIDAAPTGRLAPPDASAAHRGECDCCCRSETVT